VSEITDVGVIVRDYLAAHGFAGLISDECVCDGGGECGSYGFDCQPAYRVPCVGEKCELSCIEFSDAHDWCYTTEKPVIP
jgi:hypothetical protein